MKSSFPFRQAPSQRLVDEFCAEVNRNWESYQVQQQLRKRSLFALDACQNILSLSSRGFSVDAGRYYQALSHYNEVLTDCQQYEEWYRQDVARQSKETARILHEKQEMVEEIFAELPTRVNRMRDDVQAGCGPVLVAGKKSTMPRPLKIMCVLVVWLLLLFVVGLMVRAWLSG